MWKDLSVAFQRGNWLRGVSREGKTQSNTPQTISLISSRINSVSGSWQKGLMTALKNQLQYGASPLGIGLKVSPSEPIFHHHGVVKLRPRGDSCFRSPACTCALSAGKPPLFTPTLFIDRATLSIEESESLGIFSNSSSHNGCVFVRFGML